MQSDLKQNIRSDILIAHLDAIIADAVSVQKQLNNANARGAIG